MTTGSKNSGKPRILSEDEKKLSFVPTRSSMRKCRVRINGFFGSFVVD